MASLEVVIFFRWRWTVEFEAPVEDLVQGLGRVDVERGRRDGLLARHLEISKICL